MELQRRKPGELAGENRGEVFELQGEYSFSLRGRLVEE